MHISAAQKRFVDQYYKDLAAYKEQDVTHETAVRSAFQNLLANFAPAVNWMLIPEETLANGKRPDGTLRNASLTTPMPKTGATGARTLRIGR